MVNTSKIRKRLLPLKKKKPQFNWLRPVITNFDILAIEFLSPQGDIIQLSPRLQPTAASLALSADLSITQFAMDDQYIYAPVYGWQDLLDGRFRYVDPHYNAAIALKRMHKYIKRGFYPRLTALPHIIYISILGLLTWALFLCYHHWLRRFQWKFNTLL